jgi:hypothetical protein
MGFLFWFERWRPVLLATEVVSRAGGQSQARKRSQATPNAETARQAAMAVKAWRFTEAVGAGVVAMAQRFERPQPQGQTPRRSCG